MAARSICQNVIIPLRANGSSAAKTLDPALIRPGRVDMKEFVGYCDREQVELMFLRFYKGDKAPELSKTFATKVMEKNKVVSPAQIQGYFMFHKHSPPEDVVLDVDTIWTLG